MHAAILAAPALKIVAGLAQLGFALLLLTRVSRSAFNPAFATSFGANGLAYSLFNLALLGQRTPAGHLLLCMMYLLSGRR